MAVAQTGWSNDGNWFWDGARWNDAISEDAQWRYDGASWQPFTGQRTAMPSDPFHRATPPPPSAPPPAPPAPVAAPSVASAMPSWVDPSEIQRMESEKIERRLAEMTPAEPLPPERDWRRVGEFMEYGKYDRTPTTTFWKTGWTSFFIYLALLWLCSPAAVIYVWLTEWRLFTKVYRTAISLFISYASLNYLAQHLGTLPG